MFRLDDQFGSSAIKVLSKNTTLNRAIRLQKEGMLGILSQDERRVEVVATNILVLATRQQFVDVVAERFGGSCERVRVEGDDDAVFSIIFIVPTDEHLRNPHNFLISVQRKLTEIIEGLDRAHTETRSIA